MTAPTLTAEQIAEMRWWAQDCLWTDVDTEDLATLPDAVIVRGIARNYDGGVAGFLADGAV